MVRDTCNSKLPNTLAVRNWVDTLMLAEVDLLFHPEAKEEIRELQLQP